MIKLSHATLVALSGILWLIIGFLLMSKGSQLLAFSMESNAPGYPLIDGLTSLIGTKEKAALMLIVFSLTVGYLKGRFVLAKTVNRVVNRILAMPNPACLSRIYSKSYYFLIAGMMFLGIMMNYMKTSSDLRGVVDLTIGAALINGAVLYFRAAQQLRRIA